MDEREPIGSPGTRRRRALAVALAVAAPTAAALGLLVSTYRAGG